MGNSFKSYILAGLGLVATIWFLASYPSQDPRSAIRAGVDRDSVEQRAVKMLSELGYSVESYERTISFKSNRSLLDSLQNRMGRSNAIRALTETPHSGIKPYYWEIRFNPGGGGQSLAETGKSSIRGTLAVRADTDGQLFELRNSEELLPDRMIHRDILRTVLFDTTGLTTDRQLVTASDSLLSQMLYFDFQRHRLQVPGSQSQDTEDDQEGVFHRLSTDDAERLAEHYLQRLDWNLPQLKADTVIVQRIKSANIAQVQFKTQEPVMGQHLTVTTQVAPTGSLIHLQVEYAAQQESINNGDNIWNIIRGLLIFLFGLGTIIIFFFRSRARAVDTRSALVAGIIAGLVIPLYILLERLHALPVFNDAPGWMETVFLAVQMGMSGSFSSVAFFVLFATGDSITRQYQPQKLESFDYLRQGLFYNKAIGRLILRSLTLALILAGGWSALLCLFPDLYLHFDFVFYTESVSLPLLYLFLEAGWFSFCIVTAIFLVISSQVYARTKNLWLSGASSVIACGVVAPVLMEFGPSLDGVLLGMTFGAGLTLIYMRWDFLTALVSHFLFLGLMASSTGWITGDSPDAYVFIFYVLFLMVLGSGGILAYLRGSDERTLSRYVPGYVEELAQEERIRQELQIAREVQQSFLPVRMPEIPGLNIAAFCRPAYETGGDYYDFIRLDNHRVALAIGDVSGKGIQAAFYMTFIKGVLHSLCRETDSPAELLTKANRLFCESAGKGTFISLVYGIIDLEREIFTFARAGHNPVIHINAESNELEELRPPGLGLGLTKDGTFQHNICEVELPLKQGDLLVLYTDGVVEALSERHQFYGNKRLISLLKKHKESESPDILTALFNDIKTFIGKAKQHDDMTAVVLKLSDITSKARVVRKSQNHLV